MRRALVLALLAAAVTAAPASARERLISEGPVERLQAGGGWVSWAESGSQMMFHDGESMVSHAPFVRPLGTDARGRAVGLLPGCDDDRCVVRHLLLPEGAVSKRFTTAANMRSVDEYRGSLLVGFRGRGHPHGVYLRRRGDRSLERLSRIRPGELSISTGAMASYDRERGLYAAGRNRPHRWRRLERGHDPGLIGPGPGFVRFAIEPQADGRHVFWVDVSYQRGDDGVLRGPDTEILRVDPGASDRHVRSVRPPRAISELAVTNGNLYYADRSTGALYEVRHPQFLPSGDVVPIEG